jgi:hypothetical protein
VAPHFDRLQDPEFREITRKKTAESVAEAHDKVNHTIITNFTYFNKNGLSIFSRFTIW